ncbi:MAG: tetratricopeptide repeat protein [Coriobacteriia bacterium]|nr:tetratricopeptide repeat protein [Coriobacteriia bacterium]
MAIDKKNSPGWYKVVVWIVLIVFVVGMAAGGLWQVFTGGLSGQDTSTSSSNTQSTSNQAAIDKTHQAQVTAALAALKAQPNDFTANKNVAQAYALWAQTLMDQNDSQSQAAAPARFKDAVPYLRKAYSLKPTDTSVANSYVLALAYSGDPTQALAVAREVTTKNPNDAEAWLNLGVLLANSDTQNAKADAIAALRTAIQKDTSGTLKATAQQEIDTLNKTQ